MAPCAAIPVKWNPRGAIFWDLPMKQWPELWICFGFISTLSVIFKQQRAKQISLALHCRHCWLIWLTDEYKIISNSFSADKQMKHRLALNLIGSVIPGSVCFPPLLVGHEGHSARGSVRGPALCAEAGRRGWASSPGGQSATVTGSIYPLSATESGQVEGASPWAGTVVWMCWCVSVCMQREQSGVCWRLWPLWHDRFPLCRLQSLVEASQHFAT